MSEQIPVPLPSEGEYTSAIEEVMNTDHIDSVKTLDRAMRRGALKSRGFSLAINGAINWSRYIEPYGRLSGSLVHTGSPVSQAFLLGSGFGLLAASRVHHGFVGFEDIINSIPNIDEPDKRDPFQYRHEIAEQIIQIGQDGLDTMGQEANDRLMDIEMLIVKEVEHQRMFRIGCGIVALGGFIAHEKRLQQIAEADQKAFAKSVELAVGADWDSALIGLLGDK